MTRLHLMDETNVKHLLIQHIEQLGLRGIERVGSKAVLEFAVLRTRRDWCRWRRLELVNLLKINLVCGEHVGSHCHLTH